MTREERSAHWRHLIDEQAASGLNGAAYCRERQINQDRFYHWRRRFRRGGAVEGNLSQFVQLMPYQKSSSSGIHISIANSISIEVDQGFHPLTLRQVMDIVFDAGSKSCLP